MSTNIVKTIQSRLDLMGISQASFAKNVGATPAQMGIFLKGKGSLSTNSLDKCFETLGIKLSLYSKRNELAKEIAEILILKSVKSIEKWTKNDLMVFTNKKEISYFFDVETPETLKDIEQSGVVDIESTFPYFKALVAYYIKLKGETPTGSKAHNALEALCPSPKTEDGITQENDNTFITKELITSAAMFAGVVLSKGAISLFAKTDKSSLFAKAITYLLKE